MHASSSPCPAPAVVSSALQLALNVQRKLQCYIQGVNVNALNAAAVAIKGSSMIAAVSSAADEAHASIRIVSQATIVG